MDVGSAGSFRELLNNEMLMQASFEIPLFIGESEEGKYIFEDLSTLPHVFICGATGSGKSSLIQANLALIAAKKTSEKVKFIIYDSKSSDYTKFDGVSHLCIPIEYNASRALGALQWTSYVISCRLRQLYELKVKDISAYNRIRPNELYRIIVVIDDINELLSNDNRDEIIKNLQSILTNGRTVGVHCVAITSAASNKRIRNDILPYFPSKICFAVTSSTESKAVLESPKAAELPFPGGLVFKGMRNQCVAAFPCFSDEELMSVISENTEFSEELTRDFRQKGIQREENAQNQAFENANSYDEMIPECVEAIFEAGSCSVSMLQRRIKLGYSRAANIVDQLEELGVVGPYEGAKPRSAIIDRTSWERIAKQHGIELGKPRSLSIEKF